MNNKLYEKVFKIIKENKWYFIGFFLILFIFNFELPYSVEIPGGFISLNERISVNGSNDETGEFGMAYVSVLKGTIPFILYSYVNNDWDTIPSSDMTYDNETISEMNQREKLYLNEAVSNAQYVAYKMANKDIKIINTKLYVAYLDNADSTLKVNDIITKFNGSDVDSLQSILDLEDSVSDSASVEVIRDGKTLTLNVPFYDYNGTKKMGAVIIPNYDLEMDPNMTINEHENESGPSGGLMMSLSIYDKLTDENLTHGDKIIGTGTIDMDGNVGEIGGVKYKLIGAVKSGAKVFLCPMENYEEAESIAKEHNYDITIKGVRTFNDAVEYLRSR